MNLKTISIGVLLVFLGLGIAYGGWYIKRKINYTFQYEAEVENTIKNMYEKRIEELEKRVIKLEEKTRN